MFKELFLAAALASMATDSPTAFAQQRIRQPASYDCSQIPLLQNQFDSLTREINVNQQVVRNFAFDKTVEEIEFWGRLPERQLEDAKSAFRGLLFDAILTSVSETAGVVGSLTPEEVDALNRLADAQGAPPLGIVERAQDVHRALEFLDKAKGAYETGDAIRKRQMLDAAVKLGGLVHKNPAFGLLLTADEWAAYQTGQSITAVLKVRSLTSVNEGDLKLLSDRSGQLKSEITQLAGVKARLAELGTACDSTKLVKKPRKQGSHTARNVAIAGGIAGAAVAGIAVACSDGKCTQQNSTIGGNRVSGQCPGLILSNPSYECKPCTCSPNVDCINSPGCGGAAVCVTDHLPAPYCH